VSGSRSCHGSRREPGKAAYLELENDADLNFAFFLAKELRMTVATLTATMSNAEWVLWTRYYARLAQDRELELAKMEGKSK
jgi:hypothetical protein